MRLENKHQSFKDNLWLIKLHGQIAQSTLNALQYVVVQLRYIGNQASKWWPTRIVSHKRQWPNWTAMKIDNETIVEIVQFWSFCTTKMDLNFCIIRKTVAWSRWRSLLRIDNDIVT